MSQIQSRISKWRLFKIFKHELRKNYQKLSPLFMYVALSIPYGETVETIGRRVGKHESAEREGEREVVGGGWVWYGR